MIYGRLQLLCKVPEASCLMIVPVVNSCCFSFAISFRALAIVLSCFLFLASAFCTRCWRASTLAFFRRRPSRASCRFFAIRCSFSSAICCLLIIANCFGRRRPRAGRCPCGNLSGSANTSLKEISAETTGARAYAGTGRSPVPVVPTAAAATAGRQRAPFLGTLECCVRLFFFCFTTAGWCCWCWCCAGVAGSGRGGGGGGAGLNISSISSPFRVWMWAVVSTPFPSKLPLSTAPATSLLLPAFRCGGNLTLSSFFHNVFEPAASSFSARPSCGGNDETDWGKGDKKCRVITKEDAKLWVRVH